MKKMSAIRLWAISLLSMLCFGWSWAQDTYVKVTSEDQLEAGAKYLIVSQNYNVAMGPSFSESFRPNAISISITNETITTSTAVTAQDEFPLAVLLEKSSTENQWYIRHAIAGKYFSHKDGTNFVLNDNGTDFSIEIDDNGNAKIHTADGKNSPKRRYFACYQGNSFRPYNEISTNQDVQLYMQSCPAPSNLTAVASTNSVVLSWDAPSNVPAQGYIIQITPNEGGETITKNTDAETTTITVDGLTPSTLYDWSVASNCGDGNTSSATQSQFTTLQETSDPTLSMAIPQDGHKFEGQVSFSFAIQNFTLGKSNDGFIKISINPDTVIYTDQTTHSLWLSSGNYSVQAELVKTDSNSLDMPVSTESTSFSVDLPDAKAPSFLPDSSQTYSKSVTVSLTSETSDASIFYSFNNIDFQPYNQEFEINDTTTIYAYAVAEHMDTSSTSSATYNVFDGDIILFEDFRKVLDENNSTTTPVDDVTQISGWTAENLYKATGKIKLGSGKQKGSLTTPTLDLSGNDGFFTVMFDAAAWKDDERSIRISSGEESYDVTELLNSGNYDSDMKKYSFVFHNGSSTSKITFSAIQSGDNRFFIDNILIIQGTETKPVCELVSNINTTVTSTTADINFEGSAAQYAYRYGSVKAELESADVDTVKEKHIAITDLTAETKYFFQIKSLCSATNESEWTAVDSFTTVSSTAPTLNMSVPKVDSIFTGEVSVKYAVNNFELGKEKDGFVKIAFSNGDTVYTDQLEYKKWMKSGKYSVALELVDTDSTSLSSPVMVAARNFSVNLPDVATPVITPDASIVYMDSVKVSISCATEDATILYSVDGNEPSIEYTGEFILKSTATVKAIAFAQNMDTSLIASARFSIRETVEIEGDLVFAEYFDKVTEGSLGQNGQNTEITDKLDANTEIPGWTGSKVYAAGGIIKLGSSSKKGYITTPAINLSNNEGVFYVSFQTMAWKDDPTSILLIAGEDTVTVEGLLNSGSYTEDMSKFVYKFENGTEETKLTFAAIADKNRFFLDSIEVYQVLPEVPMFVGVPSSIEMETIKGTPVSKEVSIKGRLLSENVSLASSSKNITLSASELKKEDVMAENGATLKVTFNAEVLADTATVTLVSGELKDTIMVYASAEDFIEVANLAELRKGEQGKLYKVKSEVVLTAMDSYRNYKFIQDSTAGMLIDDANGLVTTEYEIGNGITGVYGRLASFSNQLQLAMIGNLPEASSEKVAIDTIEVSIAELNGNMEKYCSRLVRINGLSMTIDTVKEWASNQDHYAADGEDTINIRTFIRNGNFVGDTIPAEFDLVGIAGIYKTSAQVSPRFKTDIIVKAGEGGDTGVYNQWMVADINTNLYPNPSNGEFTVEMDQDAQVEIFNAMGVRVQAMNLTAGKHAVRINQSGVYFVRFSNGKASSVKRVIIR